MKGKSISGPQGGGEAGGDTSGTGAQRLMDDLLVSLLGALSGNDSRGKKKPTMKVTAPD